MVVLMALALSVIEKGIGQDIDAEIVKAIPQVYPNIGD
jgi:hypothetical protein